MCRARLPKAENCTFYPTAAEAEQAGYRPCLLCRPELAPGASIADATAGLVQRAARMLEESCGSGQGLEETAVRLGCKARHLRRAFRAEYSVSPVRYLQTCRLLLAKNLLTDTDLPVLSVAMSAGFGSLRRFNDLFKKHYGLAPTALRKRTPQERRRSGLITLALGCRPPYRWDDMLDFLARRAIGGVEVVKDGEYLRTVRLKDAEGRYVFGWIRVGHRPQKNVISVGVAETLLPVLPQVWARVRRLFDLYCEPKAIYEVLQAMNTLRLGLCVLGTRVPGCFNTFEMAVRAVLGQQITVRAAGTLASRLADAYGTPIQTGIEGLTRTFPLPEDVVALGDAVADRLSALGVTAAQSHAIYALARAVSRGEIDFDLCPRPEEEIGKLMGIRGIGSWTARYIAMRAMEWPDAFLETDAGLKRALPSRTSKELAEMAEAWRPWRSYATVNLWNAPH